MRSRADRATPLKEFPWHPVVFAVAAVIHTYVAIGLAVPAGTVLRSLLLAAVTALLAVLLLGRMIGFNRAGVAALVIPLGFTHLGPPPGAPVIMFIAPAWIALLVVLIALRRGKESFSDANRFLNTSSVLLLLILVVRWVMIGGPAQLVADLDVSPPASPASACQSVERNWYIILADAYPRADVLASGLNFDNGPFLRELAALGFETYGDARSDYPSTTLTLVSMFNMQRVEQLGLPLPKSNELPAQPAYRNALRDSAAVTYLRSRGYEVVAIESGWDELTPAGVDKRVETDGLDQFEVGLLTFGAAGPLIALAHPSLLGDERRDRIEGAINSLPAVVDGCEPRVVFAHVPAPHYPLVYERDGSPLEVTHDQLDWFDLDDPSLADRYSANLHHLNRLLADAIRMVVERDPDAVIVLMSDHGSLLDLGGPDERYKRLLVARTPGHPQLFGQQPTPIEMFPTLICAYVDSSDCRASEQSP